MENQPFSINTFFNNLPIRIIGSPEEPFFYASDIGDILGIQKVTYSLRGFGADEIVSPEQRAKYKIVTYKKYKNEFRPSDNVILLTEFGVYRLILNSRSELAVPFKLHIYNIIRKARLDESARLQTLATNNLKEFKARNEKLLASLHEYRKYSPCIYVFRKEINDDPYEHMLSDEVDAEFADRESCEYLMKYTIKPRPEDYTAFTLYGKIFGMGNEILAELYDNCLQITEAASEYCVYLPNEEIEDITANHHFVSCR